MSEPLSKIKVFCGCGDEMKMGDYDPDVSAVSYKCSIGCGNQVFIEANTDQLSPDVVKLAKVLFAHEMKITGFTSIGWKDLSAREQKPYLDEAQEIINKMGEWIVKKD